MSRWVLSDDQFIERVRRWQRYRRPVGALYALLGVAGVVLILYWVNDLRTKSLSVLNEMRDMQNPTTQQVAQSLDHVRFNIGFSLGFSLATGLTAAAGLATSGVVCLLAQSRKDKLLLRCWDSQPAAS